MTQALGKAIKAARLHRGLRQRDIAETLGVTRAAVGQWEAGSNEPSSINLLRLSALLELKIEVLSLEGGEEGKFAQNMISLLKKSSESKIEHSKDFDIAVLKAAVFENAVVGKMAFDVITDWVRRFDFFAKYPNIYAMYIYTNSFSPRYEYDDIVYVNPDVEPAVGEYGVFQIKNSTERGESLDEILRKLVFRDESRIILATLKPPQSEDFPLSRVTKMSRIIREVELVRDGGK